MDEHDDDVIYSDIYDLPCHSCGHLHQIRVTEVVMGDVYVEVASATIEDSAVTPMMLAHMDAHPTKH